MEHIKVVNVADIMDLVTRLRTWEKISEYNEGELNMLRCVIAEIEDLYRVSDDNF